MKNKKDETEEESNQLCEIVEEKLVNIKSISFREFEIISEQNKNSVCKIYKEDKPIGTGFLCLIPFPTKLTVIPVLITCNHVLKNEDIKGKEIKLIFNDKNIKTLYIDEKKKYIKVMIINMI